MSILIVIFLYQTLCAFLQIKDRKHIEQNFHSVAGVMPKGGTWGCWVGLNFSVGICDGATSTAHSSYPNAFLKKRRGYCNRLRPSVRLSSVLSPPKPLDEIQPNLVCELLT